MTMLTKDQVRQLTPEQQDALGAFEARRVRLRAGLLEQARRYRGANVAGVLIGLVGGGLILSSISPRAVVFAVFALLSLVQMHVIGLNRRLDALIKLLEDDLKEDVGPQGKDGERPD